MVLKAACYLFSNYQKCSSCIFVKVLLLQWPTFPSASLKSHLVLCGLIFSEDKIIFPVSIKVNMCAIEHCWKDFFPFNSLFSTEPNLPSRWQQLVSGLLWGVKMYHSLKNTFLLFFYLHLGDNNKPTHQNKCWHCTCLQTTGMLKHDISLHFSFQFLFYIQSQHFILVTGL